MSRWAKTKTASTSGTKNRLRAGTYVLEVRKFAEGKSRKGVEFASLEVVVLETLVDQTYAIKRKGEPEAKTERSNQPGELVSELFWFEPGDLYDLTLGRFKQACCAMLGIDESEAEEATDEEWDALVDGLLGLGEDEESAVGRRIVATVTKEEVKAKTHHFLNTTFDRYDA